MSVSAIICAAGRGERAGFGKNKLLVKYDNLTALEHALSAFMREDVTEIVVTASPEDREAVEAIAENYPGTKVVAGGITRSQSVKNALNEVTGDIVLIHDGARIFVTDKIITDCINCVVNFGSAICSLPATDTIVVGESGKVKGVPDRSVLYTVQTPQGFYTEDIKKAYSLAGNASYTDDSSVYGAFIARPKMFLGDPCNTKITYAEDFTVKGERIGFGIDTHAFGAEKNYITLCGVTVPSDSGLIAHSDGDVAIHALMDAMLSGAGLRDIGYYFPDTDDRYRGASSMNMLKYVVAVLKENNFKVQNVSVAIQAQKPRLKKYIVEMKKTLAEALKIDKNAVGISAGTNEGLGYVGEGKGITVTAVALLRKIR